MSLGCNPALWISLSNVPIAPTCRVTSCGSPSIKANDFQLFFKRYSSLLPKGTKMAVILSANPSGNKLGGVFFLIWQMARLSQPLKAASSMFLVFSERMTFLNESFPLACPFSTRQKA